MESTRHAKFFWCRTTTRPQYASAGSLCNWNLRSPSMFIKMKLQMDVEVKKVCPFFIIIFSNSEYTLNEKIQAQWPDKGHDG
jgi:hypothetical protein